MMVVKPFIDSRKPLVTLLQCVKCGYQVTLQATPPFQVNCVQCANRLIDATSLKQKN